MRTPRAPKLEARRTPEFTAELLARARAWLPAWNLPDGNLGDEADFGHALLKIAARFNSEVAERLDDAGEKMRRGFLDWLGVRGQAARPARLPVVFKLTDSARTSVLATASVRLQADAAGTPVVFETETDVRVVPGRLAVVVAVDAEGDAYYLPPPGLSELDPLETLPTQWQLKSFAAAGATKLQLEPEAGLLPGTLITAANHQYRIVQAVQNLITIEPPLLSPLTTPTTVTKVTSFAPYVGQAHNWQEHALYLGDAELLNLEAAARLEIVGARALRTGITWEYWGKNEEKTEGKDEIGWQSLRFDDERQKTLTDALALTKPKGTVELRDIGGKNSRWIRAYARTVSATDKPLTSDAFSLRVNAMGCNDKLNCQLALPDVSPMAEAMANTTPLVLGNIFFPLGKEPRQFDAFYLGSQEAFSKKDAEVQLCFEMADRTFSALAAVRAGLFANRVLAGVAKDRALHLLSFDALGIISKFRNREPLQPPKPGYLGNAETENTVALDPQPPWRLPIWSEAAPLPFNTFAGFLVAVTADDVIWVWHEHPIFPQNSGWIKFGKLPSDGPPSNASVDGLVYLADTPVLAALRDGEIFTRAWPNGPAWTKLSLVDSANNPFTLKLASIVPVSVEDSPNHFVTSNAAGLLGLANDHPDNNANKKKLFHIVLVPDGLNPNSFQGVCKPLLSTFDFNSAIRPVAIESGGVLNVAAVTDANPPLLIAHKATNTKQVTLDADTKVLAALEAEMIGGKFQVLATVRDSAGGRLTTWAPFETAPANGLFESPVAEGGVVEGAPVAIERFVVIPGTRADILITEFDPSLRLLKSANIEIGVVLPDAVPPLAINDLIVRLSTGVPVSRQITQGGRTKDGEVFYPLTADFPVGATELNAYKVTTPLLSGTFTDPDLTLDPADHDTAAGDWLWLGGQFYKVALITPNLGQRLATLITPNSGGATPPDGLHQYVRPIETRGRVAHFMRLNTSLNGSGDWNANLLARLPLIFPGKTPREQRGKAFEVALGNKPVVVVLGEKFQNSVVPPFKFLVDSAFGEWRRDAGDTSSNPELSWEYWNGKGWWKLPVTLDETQHLKTTGALQFTVPSDLASSDWAGKTNHWIRARLIGGDYGREKVTVKTKDLGGGVTEQTVDRSAEGIRSPSVVRLRISYRVCSLMKPTFVLSQDSGTLRDQSDANRTPGAIVEAFVPLAHLLARLATGSAATTPPAAAAPECDCGIAHAAATETPTTTTTAAALAPPAGNRALFIGLAATPAEAPVNLLLLVDEPQRTAFASLTVQALVADRFVPIVANDATRALSESGLLSMVFAVPPTPSDLFGQTGLTWLQLAPRAGTDGEWRPVLRGAYLNAVWASATETLTRELLGSSDGSPHLVVRLARPPVLRDTLELRVKEPLGAEERDALLARDAKSVLSAVEGLPGDWVLWKQVHDPDDEPANARVYALDEASGEIRFGDGQHGKIPPIGRDAIVAFRYGRTEPDPTGGNRVPGNSIAARTALNLISPVESVESVTTAQQAAGGAPPESDERVLRFGFARVRHRGRAVTARDLEDLALQSSPDIVQARTLARSGYTQLIVVLRGPNPLPNAAQVRELQRLLLDDAPPALCMPGALRIAGPKLRRLRIELKLLVESLDRVGTLAEFVKTKLTDFFDTTTGGPERDGWMLGSNPTEDDIAFALLDAPFLESIEKVTLHEITADGQARLWQVTPQATELVLLDVDPVRIEFATAEVTV